MEEYLFGVVMQRLFALAVAITFISVVGGCSENAVSPATPLQPTLAPEPPANLSQEPTAYLDLHRLLFDVNSPDWNGVVSRLKESGDLFTIHVIDEVKQKNLQQQRVNQLTELSVAIQKSHASVSIHPNEVRRLLEVAAYADVTCHDIEYPLRVWTLEHVADFADTSSVRAELERLKSSYASAFQDELLKVSMESRVREYARGLLKKPPVKE